MQQFAVNFILLQDHSTCLGCCPHPPLGVHKTVTTASNTGHVIGAATFFQRGQVWNAVQTAVLCTPDDGCGQHPKHVE